MYFQQLFCPEAWWRTGSRWCRVRYWPLTIALPLSEEPPSKSAIKNFGSGWAENDPFKGVNIEGGMYVLMKSQEVGQLSEQRKFQTGCCLRNTRNMPKTHQLDKHARWLATFNTTWIDKSETNTLPHLHMEFCHVVFNVFFVNRQNKFKQTAFK